MGGLVLEAGPEPSLHENHVKLSSFLLVMTFEIVHRKLMFEVGGKSARDRPIVQSILSM